MADEPTEPEKDSPKDPAPAQDGPIQLPDDHPMVRALKKANEEAAAARLKVKEFEDKDKSDGEKLTERITAAEKRANDAEAKAMRLEVASAKGLTPAQAKRLVGATQEELEADADEILEAFPTPGAKRPPSPKPSSDLRGGTDPTEDVDVIDPAKLADAIPRP